MSWRTKDMYWFCFGIFVAHKLMCFACFIFRKDAFTRKKTEKEEQKDHKRGKSMNLSQREKIRLHFCMKIMPLKDGGGV